MSTIARITVDRYDRMIAAGIFEEDQRVELLHGELHEMAPIGPLHEDIVDILNRWSTDSTDKNRVRVRIQNSIGIPELDSAPEPDVVWVKQRSYAKRRPTVDDVLLIIEVADSSLDKDREDKTELYAEAGIKDYWIVNVPEQCVEVHRDPESRGYQTMRTYRLGEEISPLSQDDAVLKISDLF